MQKKKGWRTFRRLHVSSHRLQKWWHKEWSNLLVFSALGAALGLSSLCLIGPLVWILRLFNVSRTLPADAVALTTLFISVSSEYWGTDRVLSNAWLLVIIFWSYLWQDLQTGTWAVMGAGIGKIMLVVHDKFIRKFTRPGSP
ncbi:MAG: hypothetical protein ABSE18_04415 [Minisyncoccia bacterium]|jgi:hypothetical protein